MRKILSLNIVVITLLLSCKDSRLISDTKNDTVIEIFLPKKRIKSTIGTELSHHKGFGKQSFSVMDSIELAYTRLDTIKNRLIFAGPFFSNKLDLPNEPFITNEEIIGFDFKTNTLKLTEQGAKKIKDLTPNFKFSIQFIMTANGKPILNGYFFNAFSSFWVDSYQIEYTHRIEEFDNNTEFVIRQNAVIDYELYNELPDMTKEVIFHKAFKDRNKQTIANFGAKPKINTY